MDASEIIYIGVGIFKNNLEKVIASQRQPHVVWRRIFFDNLPIRKWAYNTQALVFFEEITCIIMIIKG
jgi:hypothetical protein